MEHTRLEYEKLLMEIKEDLLHDMIPFGTPTETILALSVINVMDYSKYEKIGQVQIILDFLGIHTLQVNIDKQYANDRKFIKHQITGEFARYFDILGISLKMIIEKIFPYQNKLVEEWKKGSVE